VNLIYEEVTFETEDGKQLFGWFLPANDTSPVLLFSHGNAGNIGTRLKSLEVFHNLGLSIFTYDYRGYGDSEGTPSENGTYLDAEAAWEHLVEERGISEDRLIIFGRSLGGAVSAWLAEKHTPKALILESTFTSFDDFASDLAPFLPIGLLSRFDYNTEEHVGAVDCPVLIIHSRDDETVPFDHGQSLFESAKAPKVFLEVSGDHNTGFLSSRDTYEAGIDAFVSAYVRDGASN
jgi:fermentation-respiration switch protein FrsA (DUF1100 family)